MAQLLGRRQVLVALLGSVSALMLGPALLAGCTAGANPESLTAPDLDGGYMVFNSGGNSGGSGLPENCWLTSIESILVRQDESVPKYAYLGKECLAEGLSPLPFSGRDDYDFTGMKGWDGNYCLRHGVNLTPQQEYTRIEAEAVQAGFDFEAVCATREVQPIGFRPLLSLLQARKLGSIKKVFLKLGYSYGGVPYTIYTSCQYINLPHARYAGEPYLQPIFGRILFHDKDRFRLAYGALHLAGNGLSGLQFKLMRKPNDHGGVEGTGFKDLVTVDPASIKATFYTY